MDKMKKLTKIDNFKIKVNKLEERKNVVAAVRMQCRTTHKRKNC